MLSRWAQWNHRVLKCGRGRQVQSEEIQCEKDPAAASFAGGGGAPSPGMWSLQKPEKARKLILPRASRRSPTDTLA